MARKRIFGVEAGQEQRQDELVRDVRTPLTVLCDAIMSREGFCCTAGVTLAFLFWFRGFWLPILGAYSLLFCLRHWKTRYDALPMRMPDSYDGIDYGGELPAKGKYGKAEGIFYIGNDSQGKELWISKDDILTHMLILGTTGAGKTETLVSLAFNYLAVGSGFIYVDPKAAPKLAVQLYTMARILGRDDDFLLLNYMADKAAQETMRTKGHMRTPVRQSNTQNPFAVGTANQLSQLLFAMMPGSGNEGGNAIFSSNAQTLISGLLFVLVELRDKGEFPLYIDLIRTYLMDTAQILKLATRTDVSQLAMAALHSGLSTVGWQKELAPDKQPKNFLEQYGYARAYLGRALSLLVDNYGRIFKTSHGEVDSVDVITSRRIFLELIPSMDKDPKELKSLGQICLAGVRSACGVGLGDKVQGSVASVLGGLPTDARTPFGITVDEYAAIETPGFEILLTQGRGLGMAITVASQDFAGIKRASEAAAEQIVSNSKVKIFMTCEDPRQTFDLIKSLAGDAIVLQTGGFSVDKQTGRSSYYDSLSASAQRVARVDFRDLQKQVEGQIHVFFKGNLIRGKTFYANPPLKDHQFLRLNYLLKVSTPSPDALRARFGDIRHLVDALLERGKTANQSEVVPAPPVGLAQTIAVIGRFKNELSVPRPEVAIEVLLACRVTGDPSCIKSQAESNYQDEDELSRAKRLPVAEAFIDDPFTDYAPANDLPHADMADDFAEIGRAAGLEEQEAAVQAKQGESAVNKALKECMAPPLPRKADPAMLETSIDEMLASMSFLPKDIKNE